MATNLRLGNTRRGRKNPLLAAILEFFVRPQVPASRNKKAARVSRSTPTHVRLALAFARLRSAKK